MLWQQLRAHAWIPAFAVAAILLAKWQATEKRTALAQRPQRIASGQPRRETLSPRLLAMEESTADRLVRPVSELSLQPAISGFAPSAERPPSELVIREPQDEPLRRIYPPAIVKQEVIDRYASEGKTEENVAPNDRVQTKPIVRRLPPVTEPQTEPELNYFASPPEKAISQAIPEAALQLQPSQIQPTLESQLPEARMPELRSLEPLPQVQRLVERIPSQQEMSPVNQLARQHVQKGFSLGDRNALYAARVEFMQALQTVGQAVDAHNGMAPNDELSCSQALGRAMQALEEADDFATEQGKLAADLDITNLIASHRTTAGKTSSPVTQMAALQCYFDYARGQLISAAALNPVASQALSGLGKCCLNDPQEKGRGLGSAKSMVFHQAALATDSSNHLSANELGVLLGKYGQWSDAKRLFLQAARAREDAATWQNLAVAHQQLGEHDLAKLAVSEGRRLQITAPDQQSVGIDGSPTVQWVDPQAFAGPPEEQIPLGSAKTTARATTTKSTKSSKKPAASATSSWWMPWR